MGQYDNTEFLAMVFNIQSATDEIVEALDLKVAACENGIVEMPVEITAHISTMLTVQKTLVKALLEENEAIKDRVEMHIRNAKNRKR